MNDGTRFFLASWGGAALTWIWSDGYLSCPGAEWSRWAGAIHGLQLLAGILVLLAAVAIFLLVWRRRPNSWLRDAALANVVLVIVVGLGMSWSRSAVGQRWWWDYAHGCLAPLILVGALVVAARSLAAPIEHRVIPLVLRRMAPLTLLVIFAQVMLGALVRYLPVTASPNVMRPLFLFHLITASAVAIHVLWLAWTTARLREPPVRVLRWILLLAVLMAIQFGLGISTWTVVLGWPRWFDLWVWTAGYTVQIGSTTASLILACHITNGALLLAVSTVILLHTLAGPAGEPAVEGT